MNLGDVATGPDSLFLRNERFLMSYQRYNKVSQLMERVERRLIINTYYSPQVLLLILTKNPGKKYRKESSHSFYHSKSLRIQHEALHWISDCCSRTVECTWFCCPYWQRNYGMIEPCFLSWSRDIHEKVLIWISLWLQGKFSKEHQKRIGANVIPHWVRDKILIFKCSWYKWRKLIRRKRWLQA